MTDQDRRTITVLAEYLSEVTHIPDLTYAKDGTPLPMSEADLARERRLNTLNWELAMVLPDDLYRSMMQAIISGDINRYKDIVEAARRRFLGQDAAGTLTAFDDIAFHYPRPR
jgi:hypothetical protein